MVGPIIAALSGNKGRSELTEVPRGRTSIADRTLTLSVGDEAPNFTLTSHKGEEITLSQFRGKVVVVQFMSLAFTST